MLCAVPVSVRGLNGAAGRVTLEVGLSVPSAPVRCGVWGMVGPACRSDALLGAEARGSYHQVPSCRLV